MVKVECVNFVIQLLSKLQMKNTHNETNFYKQIKDYNQMSP